MLKSLKHKTLPYSQAVRHKNLTLAFVGSNPTRVAVPVMEHYPSFMNSIMVLVTIEGFWYTFGTCTVGSTPTYGIVTNKQNKQRKENERMENKNVKEEVTMKTLNSKLDDVIKGLILTSSMAGVFSDIVRSKAKGVEIKDDKLLLSVLKTGSAAISDYVQEMMKKHMSETNEAYKEVDDIIDDILLKIF